MTPDGAGKQPSTPSSKISNEVLLLLLSSSPPTPPDPSASKPTALTSPLAQFFHRYLQKMKSGTQSPSSRKRSPQLNGTTRSMTRRCLSLSEPCKNGDTSSKARNASARTGPTIKI